MPAPSSSAPGWPPPAWPTSSPPAAGRSRGGGAEPPPPYNRILLSAVLEGTHPREAIALPLHPDVELRLGSRVVEVHTADHEVELADRSRVPYDVLVLATGSIPTPPPIRGLVRVDGRLHEKVHAFRSLADCLRLDAAVAGATSAV